MDGGGWTRLRICDLLSSDMRRNEAEGRSKGSRSIRDLGGKPDALVWRGDSNKRLRSMAWKSGIRKAGPPMSTKRGSLRELWPIVVRTRESFGLVGSARKKPPEGGYDASRSRLTSSILRP